MADLKMMLQNLRDKSKCCKKDDFTGECYTIIHDMSIETLNMICEDGIEQLENAQIVNRWIPCSEKLPEKSGEYLVAYHPCHWDYVSLDEVRVGIDTFRGKTTLAKKKYQRVTHWMPLPEPPEKE